MATERDRHPELTLTLLTIDFPLFTCVFCFKLIRIDFKELIRLLWMLPCHIVECQSRNVVRFPFTNKGIVFEQVLNFGNIRLSLRM
jgi:hypothetical protein